MGKKASIRIISFDELEQNRVDAAQPSSNSDKIVSLRVEFEELCSESNSYACNLPPEDSICTDLNLRKLVKQEFLYKKISDDLHKKTQQANDLIKRIEFCQREWYDQDGYQEQLRKEFAHANYVLNDLNAQRKVLFQNLLKRRNCLLPQDLYVTQSLANVRKNFQQKLELFLLNFFQISLDDKESPHRPFLLNELTQFIRAFADDFTELALVTDSAKIKELRIAMLQKIGQTHFSWTDRLTKLSSLLQLKGNSVETLADKLDQWLAAFFNTIIQSDNLFEQRKQIISFYHLQAHLAELDIKLVKDYATLVLAEAQKRTELVKNYNSLTHDLEELLKNLQAMLILFENTAFSVKQIELGNKLTRRLEGTLEQLSLIDMPIENRPNLSKNDPINEIPLNRMNTTIQGHEDKLTHLRKYQTELPGLCALILPLSSALEKKYTREKDRLFTKIGQAKQELKQCENTLRYVKQNFNQASTLVDEELHLTQQSLSTQASRRKKLIRHKKVPLDMLNSEFQAAEDTVKKHIDSLRRCLQTSCRLPKAQINSAIRELDPSNNLSDQNVYKFDLMHLESLMDQSSAAVNESYHQLETVDTTQVLVCVETFRKKEEDTRRHIKRHKDISPEAKSIEHRLSNPIYKESNNILQELTKEFERILNEAINKAPTLSNDEKISIHEQPLVSRNPASLDEKNLLNRLDLRLIKIKEIATSFWSINNRYINKDLNLFNDVSYDKHFFDLVVAHLCNDHMEEFSDGDLSEFIQFIRRLLLKPLIHFLHTHTHLQSLKDFLEKNLFNSIAVQETKTSNLTFFASRTEKTLWSCAQQAFIVGKNKTESHIPLPPQIPCH